MKSRWDMKSILVGALLGAAGLAVLGAATSTLPAGSQVGRFQVSAATGFNDSVGFVVDTATGQVWTSKEGGFNEPKIK